MARIGIVFGLLLCGLTFLALVGTLIKSPTQFIPMMLGIPILFCGVVALNPHRRRQAMQVAMAIASLGAVAGVSRAVYCFVLLRSGEEINFYAFKFVVAMTVICVVFIAACVASFIIAGRRRKQVQASASTKTVHLQPAAKKDGSPEEVDSLESV